jgi:hypothetical protein
MSTTDELLANNEAYAASFDKGDLPLPPGKKIAVVACMDARLNVYGMLGLQEGDAHVIRNAGGVVTDDEIRLLGPRRRRAAVHRAHQGIAVHPPQGFDSRIRLRGRDRPVARGRLTTQLTAAPRAKAPAHLRRPDTHTGRGTVHIPCSLGR